jgi:hypothetical protein
MKQYWFQYTHNDEWEKALTRGYTRRQAIHNASRSAQRRYPGERIEFVELKLIKQEDEITSRVDLLSV